ncbi:MAG TPA: serine/threonine-protein kinase [Actinomycetota bacterium]|nr:serine/threonine-protein kinase [Actinomycetota bacterium]
MGDDEWGFEVGDEIAEGLTAVSLLGGGRSYEAYLAWDDRLHALVVVKVLRPGVAGDPGARRRIAGEADALAALQHPVLPRGFGAAIDGGRPHIVLEFLEGPRLSTLIRKQRILAIEQTMPLAIQLCSALHFMAHEGWIHLDVKPKNVVMGAPPKLIDLSIATRVDRAAGLSRPIGTDAYMAPEQCDTSAGELSPAADVWGLGVTVYEAVVGRLPYPRGDADALGPERFPQLDHAPEPMPKSVPEVLAAMVMACLAERPEHRPSATDVAAHLEGPVAGLPKPDIVPRIRPRRRAPR